MTKNNKNEIERRATGTAEIRMADDEKKRTVEGYAFLFNTETDLGWYREVIRAGAVTQDEIDKMDVRALFNHDPNQILARSNKGKGTMKLTVDEKGLKYRFEIPSTRDDILEALELGNISQSSFAFRIDKQNWVIEENCDELREILRFKEIRDVSPVTYPAYEETTVALRSYDDAKAEYEAKQADIERRGRMLQIMAGEIDTLFI